jgi:hypothetical protein
MTSNVGDRLLLILREIYELAAREELEIPGESLDVIVLVCGRDSVITAIAHLFGADLNFRSDIVAIVGAYVSLRVNHYCDSLRNCTCRHQSIGLLGLFDLIGKLIADIYGRAFDEAWGH